jgi:PAS domain S-box-containing protein
VALEAALTSFDCNLVTAQSGLEALKCVLAQDFGVIVLDISMPGMDGFETASLIRARERSHSTPILFLTAYDPDGARAMEGYRLGAVDYIYTPFDPHILRAKVAVFIELFRKTEALEASEQRFRSMFEHHPDAVFAFDQTGRVILANPACERLSGYSVEQILAEPRAYAPPSEYERGAAFFQAALRGEPQRFESVIVHKDSHNVDVWATQIPIIVDGQITGVFGIAKDITDRRTASEALRASEQRFRAVWEHAADAMVLSDPDGIIQFVNPACCALYGLGRDELIGQDFTLVLREEERAPGEGRHRDLFAAPEPPPPFRNIVRRSGGEECTVECHSEFVSQGGERVGLITIIRDITERVRTEQERETLLQALATAQERVQELLARVLRPDAHQAQSERRADLEARLATLTPRELDVLRQIATGKTNPEIGRALGLSPKAARNRVAHVLAKLGVADRTLAAVLAVELGQTAPSV